MTRQEALNRIKSSEIDDESLGRELIYIAKKLKISESELLSIFESPLKNFNDYKNKRAFIKLGAKVMSFLNLDRRLFK
jgi:hypothetical protein